MTVIIKNNESMESIREKLKKIDTRQTLKLVDVKKYSGMLKDKFKEDALVIQKKMRDEWD